MTSGDPPTGLVDRAYSVGGHATDPVAPSGGELPDRSGLIRAMGIVQIVLGGICALVTAASLVVAKAQPGGITYGIAAVNLLTTGVGSVRIRPWARRATVISAAIWLVFAGIAAVAFAYMMVAKRGFGASGPPLVMALVVVAVFALLFLGLPIMLIAVFTRPAVRATFERRRRQAS